MRVLVVHNRYGSSAPSGENVAVDQEIAMLRDVGVEVVPCLASSDVWRDHSALGKVGAGLSSLWNPRAIARVTAMVRDHRPDIVHVHNSFPTFSNFLFQAVSPYVPTLLTLHNFRLFCAAGTPLRDGVPCMDCLDAASVRPALAHRCYKGSLVQTLPLAGSIAMHRRIGTWDRHVDGFICMTPYHRDLFAQAGLDAAKLFVKPNGCSLEPMIKARKQRAATIAYIGRLSEEKGVARLVEGWVAARPALRLRLVGDGPLRDQLQLAAAGCDSIEFIGAVTREKAVAEMSEAMAVVVPSSTIEGFPMVLAEAAASGTPAIVAGTGPLPSIVADGNWGLTVDFDTPADINLAIAQLLDDQLWDDLHRRAQSRFQFDLSAKANMKRLIEIYGLVAGGRDRRLSGSVR